MLVTILMMCALVLALIAVSVVSTKQVARMPVRVDTRRAPRHTRDM